MALTTAQIATLTALVHADRPEWDRQGVLKHVEQLAADPRPWPALQAQAIAAAANPKAASPAAILWTGNPMPAVETTDTPWKTRPGPQCATHGNTAWRTDVGMFVCCWQEQLEAERSPGRTTPVDATGRGSDAPDRS